MAYICELEIDDAMYNDKSQAIKVISSLLNNIAEILYNEIARNDIDGAQMDFLEHVKANLIIGVEDEIQLPVTVFMHQYKNWSKTSFPYYAIYGYV